MASIAERFETLQVGDIMIPLDQYPQISVNSSLREAIAQIEQAQLNVRSRRSLPRVLLVFDETRCLVGTVRRRDIMRGLEPRFLVTQPLSYRKKLFDVQIDPNISELSYDRVVKGIRQQADRPVREVMLPVDISLQYNDHMITAIYELVDNNRSVLPVMQHGKVVGVLRSVELFHELAQLVHQDV